MAPVPVPAVPACPAPNTIVADWTPITDSAGVTYRLPPEFVERPDSTLPYRRWHADQPSSGYLWIGFHDRGGYWITLRRAPSPGMHEMTECIDSLAGRELLVQAWRTEGGIFRNGRRQDRYDIMGLVPVRPGLVLYLIGGGSDPEFQTLLLTVVRTISVVAP